MNPEVPIGIDPETGLQVYRRAKSFCPDADTRTIPVQYWQYQKTDTGAEVKMELKYFHANDIDATIDDSGDIVLPEVSYYTKWDSGIGRTPVSVNAVGCWTSIEAILGMLPMNVRNNFILGRG